MPKVLISDALSPAAVEIFKQRGVEVDQKVGLKPDELAAIIDQYDGLAIRSSTKVTKELLAKATKLKVVGRAGIGVDNVDVPAASGRGVVVMNTPFGNSITTAEHALAMMFALARDIPQANASTHAGKWEKSKFMGVELCGKTLGVVGCGNIGSIVADRAIGLKMKVVAYDPYLSEERATKLGVERADLDTLFAKADFITVHTPLTEQTRNVISAEAIAKMKKGVRIINCARGGLVDEVALKAALESGHVKAAALDVFLEEPAKSNPLFGMENVICTPHLGASTNEAQENVALQVAEQMSDYLMTGAVTNALNSPSVSAEDAPRLRPYLKLAEQLGSFAGQVLEGGIKAVTIEYEGAVATLNVKPLTATVLMGILSGQMDSVNMVNAPVIAKERNINVAETRRDEARDYQTIIRVRVATESGEHTVEGTLVGGGKPRITEVDGVAIEAEISPEMLYVRNEDKPGFIGRLGTKLGENNVNIATFHLGRPKPGAEAVLLVSVDQRVTAKILLELEAIPSVVKVKHLQFA
jgi:D-3-phosphoglycerate dehydrogenase / 2-oxoglutarate reductase